MSEEKTESSKPLTTAQKSRIERNRAKAQNLRSAKLVMHPYAKSEATAMETPIIKVQGTKFIDSGGGFLLEQPVLPITNVCAETTSEKVKPIETDAINIPVTYEECLECGDNFADSFLFNNFAYAVCDKCRDPDGKHSLITRTEAKAEYLLKDCDFDGREPPLKYISRKNPHNLRWGEMKLYLNLQIEKRAMEVWGSEEELMRQHENREEKREVTKVRKYNKKMKQLRMEVRSSLYTKQTKASHQHEFGPETYNEEDDTYTHTCQTCCYTETFEKM